ncbi:MAG: circularly permuted type 2 ATP-grasp protein [Hyphomicrobiales bacterium]|nr:circularly permuted type 2 ATP-grasp protein [Hyphomicrobiales bacterium]
MDSAQVLKEIRHPLDGYDQGDFFCEMFGRRGLSHTAEIRKRLNALDIRDLVGRSKDAAQELLNLGITFTVYSDSQAIDRILPFDVIPRVLSAKDWDTLNKGIIQRIAALNLFLHDIYHDQKILKDGTVPAELVLGNKHYQKVMEGVNVPNKTYVHICGTDIIRNEAGKFLVLEDNARTPSGVSYVIENRHLMMRAFPDLADSIPLADIDEYGPQLLKTLREVSPSGVSDPVIALLSPGIYNSAYFEHVFLAREMGIPLVEGQDLSVENDKVYMRTIRGLEQVHVIYRRIDDAFLDPKVFRPDSVLGVQGLFEAYRKGNVNLANAVGTGVADDKAVYAYMPRIIKYYLDEDPVIENVATNICREDDGLKYTLDRLDELVVKPVGESGGYGVVIGPRASRKELKDLRASILANPANFISQPVVQLSVCPTLIGRSVQPRHVDLRPFALTGRSTWVLPGGLTRVALKRGSLVVNSSQGGGSKDTWVLA